MELMEDTLVWPGTQTLTFLQRLEKPQEGSQQQPLEALPPAPAPRSMVNPLQPVPHQQALLQLRPPLYQSLLRHPTIPLFQPPLRLNSSHLLLLLLGLPVMEEAMVRQRRLHLYPKNSDYQLLQLWQRLSLRYVALWSMFAFVDGRMRPMSLPSTDDLQRMRCIKLKNLLETDNLPNSRNSRRLSRYVSANAFRGLADVRWHYQSPRTCCPFYPKMLRNKKRLKLVPLNKFWNPRRKQQCRLKPTRLLPKHPLRQARYP